MAIARDAASTADQSTAGGSTVTSSITTGSGSNLILLAMVVDQNTTSDNVSGVTANGAAMTRWAYAAGVLSPYGYYVYALVNASASTSYSIVATRTTSTFRLLQQVFSYTGASSTDSANATATGQGGVNLVTCTLNSTVANCWAVSCGAGPTPNSGSTNFSSRGTVQDEIFGDSNTTIATGGVTVQFVCNGSLNGSILSIALAPVAPSGPANVKTKDGVTQSTGIKTYEGVALASVKTVDGVA